MLIESSVIFDDLRWKVLMLVVIDDLRIKEEMIVAFNVNADFFAGQKVAPEPDARRKLFQIFFSTNDYLIRYGEMD